MTSPTGNLGVWQNGQPVLREDARSRCTDVRADGSSTRGSQEGSAQQFFCSQICSRLQGRISQNL